MTGGHLSTRTTLCLLAVLGALTGGVAGAAIVGKLATDGSAGAAVARGKPAAPPPSRATQIAAVAAQSPSRLPTPWSGTGAKAARAAMRPVPMSKTRVSAPARNRRIAARRTTPSAPVTPAPQTPVPARTPAQVPVRSPAPARAPEAAPKASRPSPEPAPARATPKPDPTGAFDDSG